MKVKPFHFLKTKYNMKDTNNKKGSFANICRKLGTTLIRVSNYLENNNLKKLIKEKYSRILIWKEIYIDPWISLILLFITILNLK